MIGLYCKEDDVINISSLPLVDNNIILSGKNSRFIIPILTILPYEQEICGFCLKNINDKNLYFLNNMIMVLSCKHVFHLHCFLNYCKLTYVESNDLENKGFDIFKTTCIICRKHTPDNLHIFNSYKNLLENIKCIRDKLEKDLMIL